MESPLEVLSRAATMVQDNANESRLTTKELPTTKWRRDRRLRATEYQHSISSSSSSSPPSSPLSGHNSSIKPLTETTNTTSNNPSVECPIDMSVTSTTIKPRSPPPPYREPLPGSTFATALARPSVITQAPPKRDHYLISNRENDNRSTESISMCDPVIDEHFRRSLGADYMALFCKKSPPPPQPPQSESPISPRTTVAAATPVATPAAPATVTISGNDTIGDSVDDHFAKALGDTWKKLQEGKEIRNETVDNQ